MRFVSLASGSSGNITYVGSENTHILVDTGISNKRIEDGLYQLGLSGRDIDGILLTHEHIDHIKGLEVFVKKHHVPVYASRGTLEYLRDCGKFERIIDFFIEIKKESMFQIKDMHICPFSIPHDARDPFAYRLETDGKCVAIATDIGHITPEIKRCLEKADAILIEANHDIRMLETGPYPYDLKRRILSDRGHLSNENSGKLLSEILHDNLKKILLGHLSDKNNYPDLAFETVRCEILASFCGYKPDDFNIEVASRENLSEIYSF